MKVVLFYIFISIIFLLVTFFGLGPVIFADGSTNERILTLIIVILIYVVLTAILFYFINRKRKSK